MNDSEIDVNINSTMLVLSFYLLCFIRALKVHVATIHYPLTQFAGFFFCFLQCYLLSYPHESQTKAFYCLNIVTGLSRLRSLHYNHIICASMQLPVIRFDIHFSHFVVTLAIQQDFTVTKCNVSYKSCCFIRFVSNCNCYLLISATQCLPRLCPRSL